MSPPPPHLNFFVADRTLRSVYRQYREFRSVMVRSQGRISATTIHIGAISLSINIINQSGNVDVKVVRMAGRCTQISHYYIASMGVNCPLSLAGRHSFFRVVRSWSLRLSALMDSDLAWVNGKSGRQRWCYADAFQRSVTIISEAIYHFVSKQTVAHSLTRTACTRYFR